MFVQLKPASSGDKFPLVSINLSNMSK